MKYLCVTPAVEEALRRVIDRHFNETVDIRTIFSNIEKINVSLIHPFEYFFARAQGATPAQNATGLFPSVTVISEGDNPIEVADAGRREMRISSDFAASLESELKKKTDDRGVICSPETVAAIKEATEGNQPVPVIGYQTHTTERISIEIWADNNIVKNRLYSILLSFLKGRAGEILLKEENVMILPESIVGNRSGNYNFDFGKTLFGGVVTFDVQYYTQELYFDKDKKVLTEGTVSLSQNEGGCREFIQ